MLKFASVCKPGYSIILFSASPGDFNEYLNGLNAGGSKKFISTQREGERLDIQFKKIPRKTIFYHSIDHV